MLKQLLEALPLPGSAVTKTHGKKSAVQSSVRQVGARPACGRPACPAPTPASFGMLRLVAPGCLPLLALPCFGHRS